MAGWRISIEEKDNGTVNLWHDDVPGSSGQAHTVHESWDEAIDHLEDVRQGFLETYGDLGPEVKDTSEPLPEDKAEDKTEKKTPAKGAK